MTTTDMIMPKLGLTMTEGLIAEWKVRPGESVRAGDVIFVVETDKIANEIEAPGNGEIIEILADEGETVPVGAAVARWTGSGMASGDVEAQTGRGKSTREPDRQASPPTALSKAAGERIVATPLARRLAREGGVDIAAVKGSGPRGRIKADDIEKHLADTAHLPAAGVQSIEPGSTLPDRTGYRIELSSKQLAIARRVTQAKREIPHFYLTRTADVSELIRLRAGLNGAGGTKTSITHLILKAMGRALIEHPEANRIWADGALWAFSASDVGMVVDTDDGLFIPILRDVSSKPVDRIAIEANVAAARARAGQLRRDEIEGAALSVSNLGMGGVASVAPIISSPHSATLGVGAVSELFRPDPDGKPTLRRELHLTLSCDHRVFDGMTGARLLDSIVKGLAKPYSLLMTQTP